MVEHTPDQSYFILLTNYYKSIKPHANYNLHFTCFRNVPIIKHQKYRRLLEQNLQTLRYDEKEICLKYIIYIYK